MSPDRNVSPFRRALPWGVLLGIPLGLSLFTFRYAEGLSYFSKDPRACTNCHIMQDEYDSWAKSGHHHVAGCNDCHLPTSSIPKLLAKARNGWNHSSAFTLENFHEPIKRPDPSGELPPLPRPLRPRHPSHPVSCGSPGCLRVMRALSPECRTCSDPTNPSHELDRTEAMTTPTEPSPSSPAPSRIESPERSSRRSFLLAAGGTALVTALIAALLTNIFQHKEEAKNPYIRFVNVSEETTDPAPWGVNWPREYDTYRLTSTTTRTTFGGHGGSEALPREKTDESPWLARAFAGYAFALDYRDRRGHAYMLSDQEMTRRVTERPQPGSCLQCHSSVIPTYRRLGQGDVMKGFEILGQMNYQKAHEEIAKTGSMNPVLQGTAPGVEHVPGAHPVACLDCHDPSTMQLRVTRPGFLRGIAALQAHLGRGSYDPNRDATRQEMRTFVCAQCHVEYYCGPKTTLFYPWNNGLRVEEIEAYYDGYRFPPEPGETEGHRFYDWKHAETGAELLKAQHPEFELYSQGIHARSGVACADCHMPYERQGATKVSDHWVRSPLLNISRACQPCHAIPEEELKFRAEAIQSRNAALLARAGSALLGMLDSIKEAKASGATEREIRPALELQRKAQWRLDFIAAENSMGFHAPQEAARVLAEAIDYSRQAEIVSLRLTLSRAKPGTTPPAPK